MSVFDGISSPAQEGLGKCVTSFRYVKVWRILELRVIVVLLQQVYKYIFKVHVMGTSCAGGAGAPLHPPQLCMSCTLFVVMSDIE